MVMWKVNIFRFLIQVDKIPNAPVKSYNAEECLRISNEPACALNWTELNLVKFLEHFRNRESNCLFLWQLRTESEPHIAGAKNPKNRVVLFCKWILVNHESWITCFVHLCWLVFTVPPVLSAAFVVPTAPKSTLLPLKPVSSVCPVAPVLRVKPVWPVWPVENIHEKTC